MNEIEKRRADPAGFVIAGLLLALAAVIYWDATRLQLAATYGLGPKAMPFVVATGLALLAVGNFVLALTGGFPAREPIEGKAIALILGGLAVLIALIGLNGGFIPATTILFAATAAAFGRRAFLVDLLIGFVLSVVVYLVFARLLTLSLPMGPIERLL